MLNTRFSCSCGEECRTVLTLSNDEDTTPSICLSIQGLSASSTEEVLSIYITKEQALQVGRFLLDLAK